MANAIYNSFKGNLHNIAWDDNSTTTIKVALCDSSYAPDIDTHTVFDDVTNEITGTGYTEGGAEITNRTITIDTTNDCANYDSDDVTWASSTITARYGVIYKDTGDTSTSPLIACIDFTSDKSSTDGDFVISWNTDGIFKIG